MQELIESVIHDEKYLKSAQKLKRMMEFEELRMQKGAVYWSEYAYKFGTKHLANPTHEAANLIQTYDLDIKLVVLAACTIAILTMF